ncbi:MAG TPA: PKD domain-containing protein [Kiritimatiellia bacterium]|nr:PKD domain-containing protein [Kiritimatiellia bacterium]HMO99209.1 PKD domain-containing protein [Kiritimatiellia bacterium]
MKTPLQRDPGACRGQVPRGARRSPIPACAYLLFLLIFLPSFATANLLTNGDFEAGHFSGWSVSGATVASSNVYAGAYAARFTGNASINQTFTTVSGRSYKVVFWLRILSETGSDWGGFSVSATDFQSWQTLGGSPFITAADFGTNWFKYAFTFEAVGSAARLSLGYFGGSGRQMVVHADNLGVYDRTAANLLPEISILLDPVFTTNLPVTQTFAVLGDDPDGAIALVEWDFGDGSFSLDASGERRIAVPGTYTARVRVADDDGGVVETNVMWSATPRIGYGITITNLAVVGSNAHLQGRASGAGLSVRYSTDRDAVGLATGTLNWVATVPLQPGLNRILLQAHTADGHIATDETSVRSIPHEPLNLTLPSFHSSTISRWDPAEITFDLIGSAATHPHFPFSPDLPRGVDFIDGVTVDAIISPDGGATEYRVPAFLKQHYRIEEREGVEWMTPTGAPVWTARFAPPREGVWAVRIEAEEARGRAVSPTAFFTVVAPTNPLNRGPIHVATNDWRYYEFADGTPFLGNGFGLGSFDAHRFSLNATSTFAAIGIGNADYFRFWASGLIWGNSWQPWSSRTLPAEGTVMAYMLSLESAYGDALGAFKLDVNPSDWSDPTKNPLIFQGFNGQSASLEPGKTYRIRVRWRTENLTGPAGPGPHGVTVKFTNWPEPGQTTNEPAIIAHVNGDTPWHVAWGDFVADRWIARNLVIALENVTGGRAFVDECAVHEVLPDGSLGPALNGQPKTAGHLHFHSRRGAGLDIIYREAQGHGMYLRTVINEKQEWALNHLAPSGLRDRRAVHFNTPDTNAPTVKLHEWHWRHLAARYGAFRSFKGIEFVNEEAPGPTDHFRLLGHLARWWQMQANPKPVSSSTWFGLAEDAWKADFAADADATDFHAYTVGNWLYPDEHPAVLFDSAHYYRAFSESWYAAQFGKPGHWGEASLYTTNYGEHPRVAADTHGVWLHKWIWARSGPAFTYPSYWFTDNIWNHDLHHLFGNWNRFMDGIPAHNSRYRDSEATSAHSSLRFGGQKDIPAGHAYLWIDHRDHTWWSVVNTQAVAAVSAAITLPMARPDAPYRAIWFDTQTGLPTHTVAVSAALSGDLTLHVTNLLTDTAVHVFLEGESDWDGDGDGIPDQWEARYVHRLDLMNASTDFDGDGFTDYAEWRAGTDPRDAADYLRIRFGDPQPAHRPITWTGGTNRAFRVQATDHLIHPVWSNLSGAVTGTNWLWLESPERDRMYIRITVE